MAETETELESALRRLFVYADGESAFGRGQYARGCYLRGGPRRVADLLAGLSDPADRRRLVDVAGTEAKIAFEESVDHILQNRFLGEPVRGHRLKPATSRRRCLRCAEAFDSTGPGNRRCPTCQDWMNRIDSKAPHDGPV